MRPWMPVLLIALLAAPAAAQTRLTQADLLLRIIDLDRLMTPPPPGERTCMFSSYDRRARIDEQGNFVDWDANADAGNFIRRENGWDVMAELDGPGAITRIWSANPHGDIRFVLDGETVIDTTFDKLMSGTLAPFHAPLVFRGLTNYVPIGFNERCQVLCRDSSSYYQINTVQFPPGTEVQRFALELDEPARAAFDIVKQALEEGLSDEQIFSGQRTMAVAAEQELGPGESLTESLDGAGIIRALYIAVTDRIDPREPYALHQLVLRMRFDGEEKPSIEAPLTDFFGSGFERRRYQSLVLGTHKSLRVPLPDRRVSLPTYMYCFFPMPYQKGWKLEIENLREARDKIGLLLYMRVQTPGRANLLRFHARYRKEDPCQVFDYPILAVQGRGRIVGCVLNVDCPRAMWWGEGDDKVWIDGETFPSYFGTGSEDYLNDAWGLHEYIHGLSGVTLAAPYGKNSAYRWHILDAINFQQSVYFSIENWQFNGAKDTYYSSVGYWYAEPGSLNPFEGPLTLADVTPPGLRIPGAVEVEGRVLGTDWGNAVKEKYAGGAELSAGEAVNITTAQPVQIRIPSEQNRVARLALRVNPRRTFETITVTSADGRMIGTAEYVLGSNGTYPIGVVRLSKGDNLVSVQCPRTAQLDCWILEDLPKNPRGPEGEDLTIVDAAGATIEVQFAELNWSAGGQLQIDFSAPGETVKLGLPEAEAGTPVALRLHVTKSPAGGRFQVHIGDAAVGPVLDLYAAEPRIQRVYLGTAVRTADNNVLKIEALSPAAESTGRRFGLDAVELARALDPHAVECEDLPVVASRESHHGVQPIGRASGDEHMWCRARAAGAWIEFGVPVARPGWYRVSIIYTRSFDYGIVQAYVNGEKAGEPVDTFAKKIEPGLRVDLGTFDLGAAAASVSANAAAAADRASGAATGASAAAATGGSAPAATGGRLAVGDEPQTRSAEHAPLKLRVEVVGKSDVSPGYYFGVDCVVLEPVRE